MLASLLMFLSLLGAAPQEKVEVTRFSDRVTVTFKDAEKETVLFYNSKLVVLEEKDRVDQGPQGVTVCRFADDSTIKFSSISRYSFEKLTPEKKTIRIDDFTHMILQLKGDLTLIMPGNTILDLHTGEVLITKKDRQFHIKNNSPAEITAQGPLVGKNPVTLGTGKQLSIPIFDLKAKAQLEPIVKREIEGVMVKTTGGYQFEEKTDRLIVSRPTTKDGLASVGGVRVFLQPGQTIVFNFNRN